MAKKLRTKPAAAARNIEDVFNWGVRNKDRGLVLLSCAYIDNLVTAAIDRRLPNKNSAIAGIIGLGDRSGKLGFEDKCNLAHGMDVFGEVTLGDLKQLGPIRNKFAHSFNHLRFTDQMIAQRCGNLALLEKLGSFSPWLTPKQRRSPRLKSIEARLRKKFEHDARERFIQTAHYIYSWLFWDGVVSWRPKLRKLLP